jgi:hypothetical protein
MTDVQIALASERFHPYLNKTILFFQEYHMPSFGFGVPYECIFQDPLSRKS